jgi:hypothetical protein
MKSISVQYQELKEGRMTQHQFLRNARMMFPSFVTNHNSFEDSVKILKTKGLLNEGNAVKGVPDKSPSYDYPTQPGKYMKVVQEPEVDEQDGIYPATTVTDIPKEEVSKPIKSKNRPDGLEPIKDKDTKNEMKKIRIVKESKKNLAEAEEKEKDKSTLSSSPGIQVPMSAQTQSKIEDFLSQFRSPGASGPGQSLNKLKDKIKEIVREMVNEYEKGDESDEAPSAKQAVGEIVEIMIDRLEDEKSFKKSELEDVFSDFESSVGKRYSNDVFQDVIRELKKKGYNLK